MKLSGILSVFEKIPQFKQLVHALETNSFRSPLGLPETVRPALVASLYVELRRPILLITGRTDAVPIWLQALESWLPNSSSLNRFIEPTPLPYERGPWSDLSRFGRIQVLAQLMAGQHPLSRDQRQPILVVTSMRALMRKTLPKRRFVAATRVLHIGQIIDLSQLVEDWQAAGYEQVSVVEDEGQFSRRGGILDIYPVGAKSPSRIELFGDEIDTLRAFDPETQRSLDTQGSDPVNIIIPPAREMMPVDAKVVGQKLLPGLKQAIFDLPSWRDDVLSLSNGEVMSTLEFYLPMVYSHPSSIIDYLPENTLIFLEDLPSLESAAEEVSAHADQIARENLDLPPNYPDPLFDWEELKIKMTDRHSLILGEDGNSMPPINETFAENFGPGPRFGGQVRPFLLNLRANQTREIPTIIVSRQAQRLAELVNQDGISNKDNPTVSHQPVDEIQAFPTNGAITIIQGTLPGGFSIETRTTKEDQDHSAGMSTLLNLWTDAEIFGWKRPIPRRRVQHRPVAPESRFSDISPGDYVVHLEYGIGCFSGLVVRAIGGMEREYLQVNYGNSDVLYVPVHHADRLSKWIGPDDRQPSLNRLGEKNWQRARAKAEAAVDEIADELLDLYAIRETVAGHAFSADSQWQAELEASFPYRETDDQLRALAEVKGDMERPHPMDRLICGDVGYGKTEVALRAAFKAVMDDKQVAMLVPTTVLAQQHYNTFFERLKPFPINLEMLSRFRTPSQQEKIIKHLREGRTDIVIGTHRLLSDDVSFKDLGLLIIDEEQRFGVSHKEQLKKLRTEVDVLTLTATPIPRTLYMSLTGARDISLIDTAPADRLPVQTYVGETDEGLLRTAILRELDRGGQIYYVHNRVQTIQIAFKKLNLLVPEASIAIAHGQMSERELEDVMVRFVNGEVDILLTTTIIESGLDIPNANTLIIENADWFGLAQLYQLRGRVGRGVRRAYAYFLHGPWHTLTNDAKSRLEVIAAQTELGAGYTIALRDLEIRGAGDLLGAKQSGHIAAVGFDLYTRLLTNAVRRRKAERSGKSIPIELPEVIMIDLPLAAYVPTDYVSDSSLRLRLYRRMAVLDSLSEIDEMAAELADRFGPIPDPVDNLLYQLRIKVLARLARVSAITSESGQIHVKLPDWDMTSRLHLQKETNNLVRASRKGLWLEKNLPTREWQIALVQLLENMQLMKTHGKVSSEVLDPI